MLFQFITKLHCHACTATAWSVQRTATLRLSVLWLREQLQVRWFEYTLTILRSGTYLSQSSDTGRYNLLLTDFLML